MSMQIAPATVRGPAIHLLAAANANCVMILLPQSTANCVMIDRAPSYRPEAGTNSLTHSWWGGANRVEGWGGDHPKIWPSPYVLYRNYEKK
jgi:hypothetical protein